MAPISRIQSNKELAFAAKVSSFCLFQEKAIDSSFFLPDAFSTHKKFLIKIEATLEKYIYLMHFFAFPI